MKKPLIVYWSRRDFRLSDNPALTASLNEHNHTGTKILPLFILEPYMTAGDPAFQFGYPSRIFLSKALPQFAERFPAFLCVRERAVACFKTLATEYELTIFVNEDVYPDFYTQVKKIRASGIKITVCSDMLSIPHETRTKEGNIYSIFTPFKKTVWGQFVALKPLKTPVMNSEAFLAQSELDSFQKRIVLSEVALRAQFAETRLLRIQNIQIDLDAYTEKPDLELWYIDEESVRAQFRSYLRSGLHDVYSIARDSLEGDTETKIYKGKTHHGKTSRMSLALAWGLVSSRILMKEIREYYGESFDNPFSNRVSQGALTYISELIWREFYKYLLYHYPQLLTTEFQEKFRDSITWVSKDVAHERFIAWIRGETGYPVVDAAMRQIATIGWMHNRARMIVASILTKNLGVDWRWGQEYFRATLIDLDEASNNGGWQWGASVGADPKPIRIFNPELQAKNYDSSGSYVETWLGTGSVLQSLRVPIVEHADAREEARKRYGLSREIPRDF